ncbi:hypothetical protein N7462_009027 [Penicillium macrosclerotiorum]|uniref:uncharacterized protein n=1 Tax=Penicillium macrosclerotiorum TaxID=303699 RepID=UPI0025496596|nr:uncharacterized protein N7462_009027 [Penicillium macrosclerotiorum]KAJ5676130.1 hypothetical protein N7462_009027 [Penicillium macrosclerotiorum]
MVSIATSHNLPLTATPPINRCKMIPTSSPVSILKPTKPTGTKRKMTDANLSLSPVSSVSDSFLEDAPPMKKRPRVTFDEKIQTQTVSWPVDGASDTSEKPLAVVREEARRAIHRHVSAGDSDAYNQLKQIFTADPKKADDSLYSYDLPTHASLKYHLMALLSHIASLDRSCSSLVSAVLNSEWLGRDETYVKLYIRFLGNLAAAQGTYLGSILKVLATKLAGVPRGTGRLPGYAPVQASEIYTRVHMALRYVLRLVPAGSGTLSPVLSQAFPFEGDSPKSHVAYTRNLIQLMSYAPELQSDILALITEKMVKVDVQIQVDLEDFEDELGENLLHGFAPDVDEELDDDDSEASDDEADDSKRVIEIKENIHKIDGMIDVLFEYYSSSFTSGSLEERKSTLTLLMSHFRTIILPTYRSRHTQFLLFHFSQLSPELTEMFYSECMTIVFDQRQPPILRQSAAAYLASFIARGAHIPGQAVRNTFDYLVAYLENMRTAHEPECRGPDLRRYSAFYSTAQAVLYIFCFRWRDLTTAAMEGDTPEQVDELEPSQISFGPHVKEFLHKAIYSRLNPLKICSPGIVTEFARIAHHFQLLYVYPLLETNKRLRVTAFRSIATLSNPAFSQVGREIRAGDHLGYQLDAYFPFDPYQLPRSRRWIEGDYVEWRGIPGLDEDDDDSDSGADDDDDVDDDDTDDDEDATATDEE